MRLRLRRLVGDATRPLGDGPKVLVHLSDDLGFWGSGFSRAVSARWKGPERAYRRAELRLGLVLFTPVRRDLTVATLVAKAGVRRNPKPPIRTGALRAALQAVAAFAKAKGASVHMPRLGGGFSGGRWEEVEPILGETLAGLDVTVYDLA